MSCLRAVNLFWLTLLLLVLVITPKPALSKYIRTKVVILGAGAAGISAAKSLSEAKVEDFVILDAQPFIGGRVQHQKFGNSYVELGANWIYGKGDNPVYKLAVKHGLKYTPNDKANVVYFDDNGGILRNQSIGEQVSNEFEAVKVRLVEYAEQRMRHRQVDLSSRSALSLLGWNPDTPLKAAVEYFNIDWEFAEPAEMCSLDYATGMEDAITGSYPLGNEFVVDERGFNYILKQESNTFLKPLDPRLMLNTKVTKVLYNHRSVTVQTESNDIIEADYAICTFSLGVLQSDDVEFEPSFPEWKREALLSFHMTTYTKIFLKFDHRFWGDWQFALYANNVSHHGGYYTVWQNLNAPGYLFQPTATGDNILMVTTTDKESHRIERMTDAQVQKEIMQVLQQMFSTNADHHNGSPTSIIVEPPTHILIPRWHQHPLFRGSYSNWPIGASRRHHKNMRAPLHNTLWFAGEAMSAEYYGYLHGAWLEGDSVAKSLIQCINSTCPYYETYPYITGCDEYKEPRFIHQFTL
ncbi:hypothetical protein BDF20DRAFT_915323 [Mycotypha africana]|uniref:uncharacterized protein n=1 Tax=Mycotypha africana TaxID=64632 RepID=UPI002301BC09|nr:uncharacterized protein BDF20DRAFT_915323 [Mycotypha africana]KAI8971522.1 hypothetical protein BDF20DRAFT_915323 [Mycotypha africana]